MRKLLVVLYILLIGCNTQEKEPELTYKYTIWTGSSAIAVGHDTNFYKIENDLLYYTDKDTQDTIMVPLSQVYKIEKGK